MCRRRERNTREPAPSSPSWDKERCWRASAALEALRLSARHDYRAAVLRVADQDAGFRRWLSSLPPAPAYLRQEAAEPAAAERPPISLDTEGTDLTVRLLGPIEVFRDTARK